MRKWVLAVLIVGVSLAPMQVEAGEKEHRQAAEELLKMINIDKALQSCVDQMLDAQIKAQPQLQKYRGTMKRFLVKYITYDTMKDDLVKIYMTEFTEEEVTSIVAFYKTTAGKKVLNRMPTLLNKTGSLAAKKVQEYQGELRKMLEEEK